MKSNSHCFGRTQREVSHLIWHVVRISASRSERPMDVPWISFIGLRVSLFISCLSHVFLASAWSTADWEDRRNQLHTSVWNGEFNEGKIYVEWDAQNVSYRKRPIIGLGEHDKTDNSARVCPTRTQTQRDVPLVQENDCGYQDGYCDIEVRFWQSRTHLTRKIFNQWPSLSAENNAKAWRSTKKIQKPVLRLEEFTTDFRCKTQNCSRWSFLGYINNETFVSIVVILKSHKGPGEILWKPKHPSLGPIEVCWTIRCVIHRKGNFTHFR